MATTTERRSPSIAKVDDSAAAPASVGGVSLDEIIDETSLKAQTERLSLRNREETKPFRQYQKKVIEKAGVKNTHQTRQITSHVCGAVARLPFVPDDTEKIRDPFGNETTEFEQQVVKTAQFAELQLNTEAVWTVSAQKLARAALDLRKEDPDGEKGIAWVNDTREDEAHVLDV